MTFHAFVCGKRPNGAFILLFFMNFTIELQLVTNLLLILGLSLIAHQISQLRNCSTTRQETIKTEQPVAWINGKSKNYDYLFHVINVLEPLGYKIHKGKIGSDLNWSLFWNHEYPFTQPDLLPEIKSINPNQRVNHIPGLGFVTSKVFLAQTPLKSGVPLAFSLPKQKQQLLDYAQKNPTTKWVQKSNAHRGIEVANVNQLDLDQKDVFVQQFVDNPLLIDGRKFDLGVYTVVTSLSPLRVYIYEGDILLRFCPEPYQPFDSKILDKYVVGDDYTPIWEMPSFHEYYNTHKLTARSSFFAYLDKQNVDSSVIWQQVQQTIREAFELNNEKMRISLQNYKHQNAFFELTRFDFLIDEQYKVYLMEANMSPNLSASHFKPNALLYEQVLFNLFSLVGIVGRLHEEGLNEIEVSDRDIGVELPVCTSRVCNHCSRECGLCSNCMSRELHESIKLAYREHLNRRQMRRIVPSDKSNANLTTNDLLQRQWFELMCRKDVTFCA